MLQLIRSLKDNHLEYLECLLQIFARDFHVSIRITRLKRRSYLLRCFSSFSFFLNLVLSVRISFLSQNGSFCLLEDFILPFLAFFCKPDYPQTLLNLHFITASLYAYSLNILLDSHFQQHSHRFSFRNIM